MHDNVRGIEGWRLLLYCDEVGSFHLFVTLYNTYSSHSFFLLLKTNSTLSPSLTTLPSSTLLQNQNHANQGSLSPQLFTPFKPFSLPSQQQLHNPPKQHSHISVPKILHPIIWPQPQHHPLWFQPSIIMHQQQLHLWWGWWTPTHSHQREEAQENDINPRIRT